MSIWPFANRAKQPAPHPATSKPAEQPSSASEKNPAARDVSRRLSKRRSLQPQNSSTAAKRKPPHALRQRDNANKKRDDQTTAPLPLHEPITPMDLDFADHRRPSTRGSAGAENITALPGSRALRTSPHLRPVTQDTADIPYNWNHRASSHHSLPSQKNSGGANAQQQRRGKLQRNQSRNKRAAYDSPLARRRSSKKRRNDPLREEEIRAMSAPIDVPKRGADTGLIRRESRKSRGPLNRNFERPVSTVSLPFEDSIHSSMSGEAEPRNYRLSVLGILSPRPAIRIRDPARAHTNETASSNLLRHTSRTDRQPAKPVQTWRPTKEEEKVRERARIDSLADELDSTELRDILERDRKRKEKRRDRDVERLKRKLERKAEKQRMKEWLVQQQDGGDHDLHKHDDLGIKTTAQQEEVRQSADEPDFPMEDVGPEEPFRGQQDSFKYDEKLPLAPEDIHPAFRKQPTEKPVEFQHRSSGKEEGVRRGTLTPMSEIRTPIDTPALDTAQAVSYTAARPITPLTPVTSTVYHGDRTKASKILGADVAGGNYTMSNTVLDEATRPKDSPARQTSLRKQEPLPPAQKEPEPLSASSTKKGGFLASLFRGKRRSISAATRDAPTPEASFSNTSREQMAQTPPAHLVQQSSNAPQFKKTGPPLRTTSIFREDLPESPLSPPDSRVHSPIDINTTKSKGISKRRAQIPSTILTEGASSRVDSPDAELTTGSPLSASKLMSQSLASVDSEASWLSGKPPRSASAARKHGSFGGSSLGRRDDFTGSYEELGIPEDEYFRRLNTPTRGPEQSNLSAAIDGSRHASSIALRNPGLAQESEGIPSNPPFEEQVVSHAGASRHPVVIHHDGRHKSSEGLLNSFLSAEALSVTTGAQADDDSDKTPEAEYPTPAETPTHERSSDEITPVQRATSVNLGKGHARNMSAGSAKLLDLTRPKSQSSTPNPPATPQRSQFSLLKKDESSPSGPVEEE